MIRVLLVGNGNVAFHLKKAFSDAPEIDITHIESRNITDIPSADVTIIAVSDDAIASVSSQITNDFVVHTSGNTDMNTLNNLTRKGVFYPLQSFSKHKDINFKSVPICLEAENENDLILLKELARILDAKSYQIDSHQRKYLHVAAVFANNFTNHMYKIASDICKKNDVPFEILYPLIEETASKIKTLSPAEAQTGPAKRNDSLTVENHLNLLHTVQQEIYIKITESIQNGEKL